MDAQSPAAPIACSLSQEGLAERGQRWRSLAERAITGFTSTPDGLRLAFGAKSGVEAEVSALADLERECCAFASWTVRVTGQEVLLEVSGTSPESAGAVREMFDSLRDMSSAGW